MKDAIGSFCIVPILFLYCSYTYLILIIKVIAEKIRGEKVK